MVKVKVVVSWWSEELPEKDGWQRMRLSSRRQGPSPAELESPWQVGACLGVGVQPWPPGVGLQTWWPGGQTLSVARGALRPWRAFQKPWRCLKLCSHCCELSVPPVPRPVEHLRAWN